MFLSLCRVATSSILAFIIASFSKVFCQYLSFEWTLFFYFCTCTSHIMCTSYLQIPNPLFDLAGITCGHFLIPFWTFFGATLIGKAIIKMHIQVSVLKSLKKRPTLISVIPCSVVDEYNQWVCVICPNISWLILFPLLYFRNYL